ncbi:MAG: ribosome silencing factor [Acidobacteria bacterium]|nr:ribosome silencing factor [Acidobacteriota bacterium]
MISKTNKRIEAGRDEESAAATYELAVSAGGMDAEEGLDERMLAALRAASDKKALELVALDLRAVASFTDFFLIASGTNVRQVQAIADAVVEKLKELGKRPARIEGYNSAEWILLDYGDFIFHIFEDKARRFFDLERLWRDAGRVSLPPELAAAATGVTDGESSLRKEQ